MTKRNRENIIAHLIAYLMAITSMAIVTAVFLPVRELLGNTATVALVCIFVIVFGALSLTVGKLSAQAKSRAETAEKQLKEIEGRYLELQKESSERLHTEETLIESENRFRSLSEEALVGIYIIQDSRFRYINPKMVEIFGYEVAELVDKLDPRELVLDEDWPKVRDNLQKRLSNEQRSIHYEFRGVRKDKEILSLEVFGSRTVIQGKPAVIGTLLDITERKRGEEEVRRLNAELRQKIVQLQETQEELVRKEKLAILGQLSGSVGHELRNPLGVMGNAIYLLKTIHPDADKITTEYLDIIKKEIDNSLRIITDLLDFARTKTPQRKSVMARALIDESLGRCTIPENVELRDELPRTLPSLKIDPLQMSQVLLNLIMNGVQAMPEGGVLTLRGGPDGEGMVRLTVADSGEGITVANMKKLFQPLFTTKSKGIGLGLVVCRNLTEANGGRIEVESEPGKGTTFALVLPAEI